MIQYDTAQYFETFLHNPIWEKMRLVRLLPRSHMFPLYTQKLRVLGTTFEEYTIPHPAVSLMGMGMSLGCHRGSNVYQILPNVDYFNIKMFHIICNIIQVCFRTQTSCNHGAKHII